MKNCIFVGTATGYELVDNDTPPCLPVNACCRKRPFYPTNKPPRAFNLFMTSKRNPKCNGMPCNVSCDTLEWRAPLRFSDAHLRGSLRPVNRSIEGEEGRVLCNSAVSPYVISKSSFVYHCMPTHGYESDYQDPNNINVTGTLAP